MLLNVLAVVGDAAGGDDGLTQDLKADLATQVVWYLTFLGTWRERVSE